MKRSQKVKQADRPDFVTAQALADLRYDSHSSRRRITPALVKFQQANYFALTDQPC